MVAESSTEQQTETGGVPRPGTHPDSERVETLSVTGDVDVGAVTAERRDRPAWLERQRSEGGGALRFVAESFLGEGRWGGSACRKKGAQGSHPRDPASGVNRVHGTALRRKRAGASTKKIASLREMRRLHE